MQPVPPDVAAGHPLAAHGASGGLCGAKVARRHRAERSRGRRKLRHAGDLRRRAAQRPVGLPARKARESVELPPVAPHARANVARRHRGKRQRSDAQ